MRRLGIDIGSFTEYASHCYYADVHFHGDDSPKNRPADQQETA